MLASIADGRSRIWRWLEAGDTVATMNAMLALGADVNLDEDDRDLITVYGGGLAAGRAPA